MCRNFIITFNIACFIPNGITNLHQYKKRADIFIKDNCLYGLTISEETLTAVITEDGYVLPSTLLSDFAGEEMPTTRMTLREEDGWLILVTTDPDVIDVMYIEPETEYVLVTVSISTKERTTIRYDYNGKILSKTTVRYDQERIERDFGTTPREDYPEEYVIDETQEVTH